jgi:hypothetical protein
MPENRLDIYGTPTTGRFYSPFDLSFDPMESLALFNFDGDPEYTALEVQQFDDEAKGTGTAALMWRTDGKVDFYMTPGLTLNRETTNVGKGVGEWITQNFDSRLEMSPSGVNARTELTLKDGRSLRFQTVESRRRATRPVTMLAPLGTDIEQPTFFPIFRMHDIDLVQRAHAEIDWRLGDRVPIPIKLPMPMPFNGKMVYFVRYCPDPMIGLLNTSYDGLLAAVDTGESAMVSHRHMSYHLTNNGGHREIRRASTRSAKHELYLDLSPALPEVTSLRPGVEASGRFGVGVDDVEGIIRGMYQVRRVGDEIRLALQPTENWSPHGGPLVKLTFLFFPPVFRTWVKTFRWTASVTLQPDSAPHMSSRWSRVE